MSELKLIDVVLSDEDFEYFDVFFFLDSFVFFLKSNKISNEEDLFEEVMFFQLLELLIFGFEIVLFLECEVFVLCVFLKDIFDSIFNVILDVNFIKEVFFEEYIKYDLKFVEEISGVF